MTNDRGENTGFWDYVATEVTCGINSSHVFYLPYIKTRGVESVYCPICDSYFPYEKGEYHPDNMNPYKKKLEAILRELPQDKKEELHALLERWP